MNQARSLISVFVVSILLPWSTHTSAKPILQKQHTDIHARFFYSAETAYRAIEVDGLKLKVTTFRDADKKCKDWVQQRPCWTEQDLVTKEARLTKRDLTAFTNLVNKSGFLLLEKTYGGAKAGQRFYAETLTVKLGEVQQDVLYQSFPDAAPRPAAFMKVSQWLANLAKRKLKV